MNTVHKYCASHTFVASLSPATNKSQREHQILSGITDIHSTQTFKHIRKSTQTRTPHTDTFTHERNKTRDEARKKTDKILNRIPHIFIGIESERCMWWYENKTRNIKPTSIQRAIARDFPSIYGLRKDISFTSHNRTQTHTHTHSHTNHTFRFRFIFFPLVFAFSPYRSIPVFISNSYPFISPS